MEPFLKYDNSTIYPGIFVPMMDEEEAVKELKLSYKGRSELPPVNVLELPEAYKIEVAIPGVKREEILITTADNILSIRVVHKKRGCPEEENFRMHEFSYGNFDRHILLPDKADTVFMTAEYKSGLLRLMIPKSIYPPLNANSRVVVY
ncbi:MAG: Hsp20/alpha crystallin family protein [Bacteroidota bacterium]|nr:Hsp20/alpha crystallin family protein [Bacteroidota bacterium]